MKSQSLHFISAAVLLCCLVPSTTVAQRPNLHIEKPVFFTPQPSITNTEMGAQIAAAGATIPLWQATATADGVKYQLTLVGKSILVSESVTVNAPVVALDLQLDNASGTSPLTFRPETTDACTNPSAVNLTLNSPVYKKHSFSFGGKSVGTTEYDDAFQRANFYQYTQPTGTSPGYHVLLNPTAKYYFYSSPIKVPVA